MSRYTDREEDMQTMIEMDLASMARDKLRPNLGEPMRYTSRWHPIASAPKQSTIYGVPVWVSNGTSMRLAIWGNYPEAPETLTGAGWVDFAKREAREPNPQLNFTPTHWHPIPQLPEPPA